jgi:hypothetical protein
LYYNAETLATLTHEYKQNNTETLTTLTHQYKQNNAETLATLTHEHNVISTMIERWENIVALYQCCRNMELNDLI